MAGKRWMLLAGAALGLSGCAGLMESSENAGTRGRDLFENRCTGCHSLDGDKEGPRLRGVYGRAAGSVASFSYSDGLKKSHIVWDAASLDKWLTDPEKVVPDAEMAFHLPEADARAAVIAYLKEVSGK